ncbi:nuclear receptor-binding protein homolog isoform X1 [Episyrphus balteatus]|uniref:nuclear receptor-binding protein homolog isoform X1 n=1 Tax=Episyrphus balteatus TaxID=286459 RepID=UPI002485842A|nr:nuclear receptor-binding protein homolog isoform X1 [Episyrphus balteatus]XP_055839805.1 nuclear receptor-binding protein homolog isoform X1 [Episyrphus balteatus]XP_055839806.1 nuclear receptor-binding protein homolog isoform X1 [Episyrphus balteatus]
MLNSRNSTSAGKQYDTSPRESGDDSEDESEILEESPCGRWLKRREEVDQRDVPGIDCVHLAMDTEEGVEVVWSEMQLSENTDLKEQEVQMRQIFESLLHLDHENIVKFHRYWTDMKSDKPRVIFITEYMSSGSLKQFLKLTKRKAKRLPLQAWRRWCTQILSALSYLHSCTPPVIHGNLTCDTLFIQHNGLVKIGSVVPDAIHFNVKKSKEMTDSRHLMAPEYERNLTPAVDIYSFGMCALEMAALEIQENSDSSSVNEESILRTINSLECELQRDLIFKCLKRNPDERPSAHELLFHPLLFEVHSLKLLAAHCLVFSPKARTQFSETIIDETMQRCSRPEIILGSITRESGEIIYRLSDVPSADKLEKFVEDVKYGVYPLTAFANKKPRQFRSRAVSPEATNSVKSATPESVDIETRRIVNMMCSVKAKENSHDLSMTILLRMDDKMNRQLTCQVTDTDTAADLTTELVRLGFVHLEDQEKICTLLEDTLRGSFASQQQHATLENSALNEPSSDSGIKSVSSNPTAAVERNWSVADRESPSYPTASGAASNDQTPSSSGGITTVFSTPTASSCSQSTEQYISQDQLLQQLQQQQQQNPQQQQQSSNTQQQQPEQEHYDYQNTIVSSTDVGKQEHSSEHQNYTQQ